MAEKLAQQTLTRSTGTASGPQLRFSAREIIAQDDVDDSSDCIRAIDG